MISCPQYDYVEIACMYKFPVQVTLEDGTILNGTASDTTINNKREECLVLRTENHDTLVILSDIKILKVTKENPHFELITFE